MTRTVVACRECGSTYINTHLGGGYRCRRCDATGEPIEREVKPRNGGRP